MVKKFVVEAVPRIVVLPVDEPMVPSPVNPERYGRVVVEVMRTSNLSLVQK